MATLGYETKIHLDGNWREELRPVKVHCYPESRVKLALRKLSKAVAEVFLPNARPWAGQSIGRITVVQKEITR